MKGSDELIAERLRQFALDYDFIPMIVKALYAYSNGIWGVLGCETRVSHLGGMALLSSDHFGPSGRMGRSALDLFKERSCSQADAARK